MDITLCWCLLSCVWLPVFPYPSIFLPPEYEVWFDDGGEIAMQLKKKYNKKTKNVDRLPLVWSRFT